MRRRLPLLAALVALAALALPLGAEFHRIRITYTPTGCVDCPRSLEGRLKKTRGVEEVKLDPEGEVVIRLAPGNRERLELIRDFIEQGGERIQTIEVEASGALEREGEDFVFVLAGLETRYPVIGAKAPAARVRIQAHTSSARPLAFTIDRTAAE
ncbi:MAG: hypothetical protein J0L64_04290 [Acidobacteria bacterium]|nr:hypothetical protein [Acidobacteriota bacterium]